MNRMQVSLAIIVVALGSANLSLGQTPANNSKSSVTTKTRSRRSVKPSTPATDDSTTSGAAKSDSQPNPVNASSQVPTVTKPANEADADDKRQTTESTKPKSAEPKQAETKPTETPAPATKPGDPVQELRSQIDAATTFQDRVSLQLKLADLLVDTGKRSEAVAELNSILKSDDFNPQGFYNTGNAFARVGESDAAVTAYRKAIQQRNGVYSLAYNNLGVILLRAGRWDEAYEALISALKLENFHYAEASYNLGRLYAARGDNDLAVREWRRVLTIDPHHTASAEAIANIGNEGSIVVASDEKKSKGKPSQPKTSETSQPAVVSHSVSKKSVGSTSSSQVFTIDPTSYDFLQRARSSVERGKLPEAIDSYHRVISRQGGYFAPANLELSYALVTLKRYDEAQENLLLVAGRDGGRYPISYFHLARLYELKGDLTNAEAGFAKVAAAYGSRNTQFLLDLSRVREKQGNFKGALEAMEQYVAFMKTKGQELSWSDERLSQLRQKVSSPGPK